VVSSLQKLEGRLDTDFEMTKWDNAWGADHVNQLQLQTWAVRKVATTEMEDKCSANLLVS
jgi:hypothetical protein